MPGKRRDDPKGRGACHGISGLYPAVRGRIPLHRCTNDLPRRLRAHQSGRGAKYTRSRLPVELIYQEPAADRSAALRREAAIKRMTHRQKWALAETYRRAAAAGGEETEG